jgi:hypothetical protein
MLPLCLWQSRVTLAHYPTYRLQRTALRAAADAGRYAPKETKAMNLKKIKKRLEARHIFHSETEVQSRPAVIGYEKKFKWRWMATQLNTFIVAIDYGRDAVSLATVEAALTEAFAYARLHSKGWPRGLQSGIGVITILASSNIDQNAIRYCRELKSGKKWSGFAVPVVVDTSTGEFYSFDHRPLWGWIYFPHFRQLIDDVLG